MKLTRRRATEAEPISPTVRSILRDGPWSVGKALKDLDHDELRRAWAVVGPELVASLPRNREAWFVERDRFVTFTRERLRDPSEPHRG